MEFWILMALAVFVANAFLPALLYLPQIGISGHVGPRDTLPEHSLLAGRARRSMANHIENIPVFLGLALLNLLSATADLGLALLGAQLFVFGRIAYMPAALSGIPWVRSVSYVVSFAGFGCLALALL